jgi:hypothetical protein
VDLERMTMVRSVTLTGKYEGLVVLRTTPDLAALFQTALVGKNAQGDDDAFNEFVNMFCGHMMSKIRATEQVPFRHFLPQRPDIDSWPGRAPEAVMTVSIQHIPLKVELWVKDPAADDNPPSHD